jgi:limonene 1,2-monooxygenase
MPNLPSTYFRFGAFIAPFHAPEDNPTEALERDLVLATELDALGYDEIWFGEHHSAGWEIIACPEIMVAAALQRTQRIKLGTGVVSLPYHHPFMVAQRIVLLDHLARGRLMFGVGPGAIPGDVRMLGVDPGERGPRFVEALEAVLALFRSREPVSRQGRGFTLSDARLQPRPFTTPHPPLYIANSFSGRGIVAAAVHDAGVLQLGGGPDLGERIRQAEKEAEALRLVFDRSRLLIVIEVHVDVTRKLALDAIRGGAGRERFEYWSDTIGLPRPSYPLHQHADAMVAEQRLIAGSPGEVIDSVRTILREVGPCGGLLISAREWANPDQVRRSYDLFAREVIPAFREESASVHPAVSRCDF